MTVNLDRPSEVRECLQQLSLNLPEYRASFVRAVVYGFASLHAPLLKSLLAQLPLVHELVLPDKDRDDQLILELINLAEEFTRSSPRLHQVIFRDGNSETLW